MPEESGRDKWKRLDKAAWDAYQAGDYAEAVDHAKESIPYIVRGLGPEHPRVATCLNNLAAYCYAKGDFRDSVEYYEKALHILRQADQSKFAVVTAQTLDNLGLVYKEQGEIHKAEPLHMEAVVTLERELGSDHSSVATSLNNLGILRLQQGELEKAETLLNRALAIDEGLESGDKRNVARDLGNLADLHIERGDYARAEQLLERSLALLEEALGPYHPGLGVALVPLARLLRKSERVAEAQELEERAARIETS